MISLGIINGKFSIIFDIIFVLDWWQGINSLWPGRSECDSQNIILNLVCCFTDWYLQIYSW